MPAPSNLSVFSYRISLHSNTDKSTLKTSCHNFRKVTVFSVFSHRPGAVLFIDVVFAAMTTEKSKRQYRQYAEDLKTEDSTMLDSDLYLNRNPCFFTALSLSPSVLFILFSVKIIWKQFQHKFQKNGEHSFCSKNTSLALNCLWIQCWDYTMHKTETNTMAVRSRET